MVERISSKSQIKSLSFTINSIVPAGSTGFELTIRVSRKGANTDCFEIPPVTLALLKADMILEF